MPERRLKTSALILLFVLAFLFSSGCGRIVGKLSGTLKARKEALYELEQPPSYDETSYDEMSSGEMSADEEAYGKELPARSAPAEKKAAAESDQPSPLPAPKQPAVTAEERKRVYSGYCKLGVDSVEKRTEEVFEIAESFGGWIEQAAGNIVIVRIPAERFEEAFNRVLDIGRLIDKSIETQDVTEQYLDLSARLELARGTRERLYRLLERTDDVKERLRILREIRRLTDEIEEIQARFNLLKEQIAFSAITVELVPRLAYETPYREKIPFAWIRNLDPVYTSIYELSKKVSYELPDDFAVFEKEDAFRAESADGTRVRIGTVPNLPDGDSLFWRKALGYHLDQFYRKSEALSTGSAECVLFTSKDREPFYYLVGVVAEKRTLLVIEAFFPSEDSFGKRYEEIERSIEDLEVR
ncbi:MAG TPA: DUF4349 domain-containing protein [Spirochaetota bacterium]|nr:DUF4349 domain-containing protein [Spirochaetota bacterium]